MFCFARRVYSLQCLTVYLSGTIYTLYIAKVQEKRKSVHPIELSVRMAAHFPAQRDYDGLSIRKRRLLHSAKHLLPIPGMPNGKPAGVRCVQLNEDNLCQQFGRPERRKVCHDFKACPVICGKPISKPWLT